MAKNDAMSRFLVKISRLEHFIYMNISRTIYSISQHCISTGTNIRIYAMFRILDPGAVPHSSAHREFVRLVLRLSCCTKSIVGTNRQSRV